MPSIKQRINQLPVIGPWASRLGKVYDIWGMPCNPAAEVWIEAAFHTLPIMAWHFFKPSPTDALTARFARAKLQGGTRFGSPHGKGGKFKLETFAIETGVKFTAQGALGALGIFGAQQFRRFGLYMTVADLTTEGLLNWHSLTYQYSGCEVPGGGGGDSHYAGSPVNLGSTSGTTVAGQTVTFASRCAGGGGTWACDPAQEWSASFSVGVQEIPGLEGPNVNVFMVDGSDNVIANSEWTTTLSSGAKMYAGRYRFRPPIDSPKAFQVVYTADKSWITAGGTFNVSGGPVRNFMGFKSDP